ncbi:MAG: type II toxin-antitoxin system mRNA interferase toxin, RelE/StbE family [Proteobacteria bacterium]|nr:type II toxin-antitoxin system mRNA interferase toxin, RelE/StbE family [Pseudomonadota bacterium]
MYKDEYHPRIKKDVKKLAPHIREKIKTEYIPNILLSPNVGHNLEGDLNGIHSYHIIISKQQYRIAYLIDEDDKRIIILMIAKRENFYNLLKRRIK